MINVTLGTKIRTTKTIELIDPNTFFILTTIPEGSVGKVIDFMFRVRDPKDPREMEMRKDLFGFRVLIGTLVVSFSNSNNFAYSLDSFEVIDG